MRASETYGDVGSGAADSGNPVKTGGQARTTNPTAVSNAQRVNFIADKLGRQLNVPYQVRELVSTGYATLTRSQEGTVISAVAGAYLDLIQVKCTNTSSVAVPVIIRNVTAGSTIDSFVVPAGGSAGANYEVPYPASDTGNNITAQVNVTDQSDSPVTVTAIAVQNT